MFSTSKVQKWNQIKSLNESNVTVTTTRRENGCGDRQDNPDSEIILNSIDLRRMQITNF